MSTSLVRDKLRRDYGIQDIPAELLSYLCGKHRQKYEAKGSRPCDEATCAFLVASEWQRGRDAPV